MSRWPPRSIKTPRKENARAYRQSHPDLQQISPRSTASQGKRGCHKSDPNMPSKGVHRQCVSISKGISNSRWSRLNRSLLRLSWCSPMSIIIPRGETVRAYWQSHPDLQWISSRSTTSQEKRGCRIGDPNMPSRSRPSLSHLSLS